MSANLSQQDVLIGEEVPSHLVPSAPPPDFFLKEDQPLNPKGRATALPKTQFQKFQPDVWASFFYGIILLFWLTVCWLLSKLWADTNTGTYLRTFPLSHLTITCFVVAVISMFVMVFNGCQGRKSSALGRTFLYCLCAQVPFIGGILLFWWLNGQCADMHNQCVIFLTLDPILLFLLTLPWQSERSDIAMAFFLILLSVTTGILLWNLDQIWNFTAFSVHWKTVLGVRLRN
eukprot:TRINITY_DN1912_c0_g1_i8.p1 TRINITY_DN1912_c0_g1~~TRINITY_DN1912_c0_g1_i8.p1  ORF type:complete len:258 (-),score=19.34 TRINITY_DN1912_c0_g1_i8:461-1153(-)